MKLYFASGNLHKKEEMSRLLGGYELTLPKEEGLEFSPIEDGNTFIENAIIKAKTLYDLVKQPVIADDSGLCVEALGGMPGIHTARFGCEERQLTSREQYTLLLENMNGEQNRRASFVCALVLYVNDHRVFIIEEEVQGEIALTPHGVNGFGYDPVFIVENTGKTASELSPEEKDNYSHRGRAARKMKTILGDLIDEKK